MSKPKTQDRKSNISMHPLTPDQALRAALQVKAPDVAKLEAAEKKRKNRRKISGE